MDARLCIIALCVWLVCVKSQTCKTGVRCKISRIRAMKAADCYNKDMTTISQCLPKDVEIIDFSHNRIRKIAKEDLDRYSDVKILYLNDNLIGLIGEEAFEGKDYLHTLDLSLNGITKLSPVLFHLPSLRSLYLGQNLNMNIADVVEKAKPVTSPLIHLDISYIMSEEPNVLPDFGLLTTLEKYNISGNKLLSLNAKSFAGLCNLKILDTTNVSLEYEEGEFCNCWVVNRWLKSRAVSFKPFICSISENECLNGAPDPDDLKLYQECKEEVKNNLKKSKMKTVLLITVPVCAIVLLTVFMYCFLVRRKRKQRQRRDEDQENEVPLNNALINKKM